MYEVIAPIFIPLTMAVVLGVIAGYLTGVFERPFRFLYGDLTRNEAIKFVLYGALIMLIIGIYWELRCVKDSIFDNFIGAKETAWAKVLSLVVVFPLVIGYSYLVDLFSRKHLFYVISFIYASAFLGMSYLLKSDVFGMNAPKENRWFILGYITYVMIESFGTLVVALFYAFMADTTKPEAAKKGYFVTATLAQVGAILGSWVVQTQAKVCGVPYLMNIAGLLILLIPALVWFIMWYLPKEEFVGYQAKGAEQTEKKKKPGFVEGLKLMFSEPYLFAIFFIVCAFEIIVTIFDLQFKILIGEYAMGDSGAFAEKSGQFGVALSLLALYSLLFGLGKIGRKIGITYSLALMPILIGINIFIMTAAYLGWLNWMAAGSTTFLLTVVFWVQVVSKGINYALGQPSKEQLYIPTSKDAKYKSKGWIEMFGSRGSKATGAGIKIVQQDIILKSFGAGVASTAFLMGISSVIAVIWFFFALYAGRTNRKAVEHNEIVC
jgi:ATP:ADP antiporter, AAA family